MRQSNNSAALIILITLIMLIGFFIWYLLNRDKVTSPLPPDSGIKIIFLSPTPEITLTNTPKPVNKKIDKEDI
jgi:hypothetical protein